MWVKIDVKDAKKGAIIELDNDLFRVVDSTFMQCQQRQGNYTLKLKNLVSGSMIARPFKSGTMLDKGEVITKNAIFLYSAGDTYAFMENDTGEIHDLDKDSIEDTVPYLKENMDLFLMVYQGNVLNVILPPTVSYIIKSTLPGVKGDRAQAGKKPATLETGLEVQVPLHKAEGDTVTVNTETGDVN